MQGRGRLVRGLDGETMKSAIMDDLFSKIKLVRELLKTAKLLGQDFDEKLAKKTWLGSDYLTGVTRGKKKD